MRALVSSLAALGLLGVVASELLAAPPPAEACETVLASGDRSAPSELGRTIDRLEACRDAAHRAGDLPVAAESLRLLAVLRGRQGRWPTSLRAAEEALTSARRTGDPGIEAWALMTLGDAEFYLWRFQAAARRFEAAAGLFRRAGDPLGQAHALKNLGIAYKPLGRRDLAILHLERAMERYPEWRDDELAVSILGNLGTIYSHLGAPRSALRTLERALRIARARDRPNEVADVLGRLGYLHLGLGLPEKALDYFREALTAASEAGPATDLPLLQGAASAFAGTGDETAAEAALETLVAKHRRAGNRIAACLALTALARFVEGGQTERTRALYREAEALAGDRNLRCRWESLAGRARLAHRSADHQRAIDLFGEALATAESQRRELVSDHDRAAFAEETDGLYRTLAELLIERARGDAEPDPELAFHVLERMRASTLTRGIAEARLPPPRELSPAQARRLDRLEAEILSLQESLSRLAPGDVQLPERRERLRRREAELDEHLRNLRRASGERALPSAVTAPELRGRLPADTAVVAYLVGDERTFAFIVSTQGTRVVELPVPRARLAEQVGGFLDLVGDRRSPGWAAVGHRLYRDLVAPWAGALPAGVETLVVVPDRELRSLPLDALPRDPGGRRLLLEDFAVAYAPSATALLRLAETTRGGAGDGLGEPASILTFADPRSPGGNGGSSPPLRALYEEEGHDLATLPFGSIEGRRIARFSADGGVTLMGAEATEQRAKTLDASRFGVIHFATHGLLSARDPRRSALLLGTAREGREDGFLQAREIELLRLDADLVVLSACRTARGARLGGGEAVRSLAEAFFLAGARSVVGTLWDVEDRSAMRLMTSFYRHLSEGRGKAESLRAAKLEALSRGTPPSEWAGFVLLGEPFAEVGVVPPGGHRGLYAAGLVLLTALLLAGMAHTVRSRGSRS